MSETFQDSVAAEYQISQSENAAEDFINPNWDDSALTSFVRANADVMLNVGGTEMTLSSYVIAHQGPWTPENELTLMADFQEKLANNITKIEESEEEGQEEAVPVEVQEQPEEEQTAESKEVEPKVEAKSQSNKVQKTINKEDVKQHLKTVVKEIEQPELSADIVGEVYELKDNIVPKPKLEAVDNVHKSQPEQVTGPVPEAGPAASAYKKSENAPRESDTEAAKEPVAAPIVTTPTTQAELVEQVKPISDIRLTPQPEAEAPYMPVVIEATLDTEPITEPFLETEHGAIEYEGIEPVNEEIRLDEDETAELVDLSEEEPVTLATKVGVEDSDESVYIEPHLENAPEDLRIEQAPIALAENEPVNLSPNEAIAYVQPVPAEEIEKSMIQIVEHIEDSEPEIMAAANKILDEIKVMAAKLEAEEEEDIIDEAQVQEELEQLFTELFETLGIEYTPVLIESLVALTAQSQNAYEIGKDDYQAEATPPHDRGTHEVIRELLASLGPIKITLPANAIGKSALRLYSYSLAA